MRFARLAWPAKSPTFAVGPKKLLHLLPRSEVLLPNAVHLEPCFEPWLTSPFADSPNHFAFVAPTCSRDDTRHVAWSAHVFPRALSELGEIVT